MMRLSTCLSLSVCLAAATLLPVTGAAHALSGACAGEGRAFPLTTQLRGGPPSYEAGGGYGIWFLDLKNTTDRTCEDVHPVVVLVDEKRELRASQPRLEFYAEGRPHPVRFLTTDRDELVGVLDRDGPGLTIGPRQTRTVKLRLSVTSDAVANEVTATAAVVQRRDDDGDWVGQSNDYRFRIADGRAGTRATDTPRSESQTATPATPGTAPPGRQSIPGELARTGRLTQPAAAFVVAAAVLLLSAGCALVLARRRRGA